VQAGSGASITDNAGDVWTLTSGAQVAFDGSTVGETSNAIELAFVGGVVWQENSSGKWYTMADSGGTAYTATGPITTSPLPSGSSPNPSPAPASTPPASTPPVANPPASPPPSSGTRDPSQVPFASDSVFNLPLGSGAQWQQNGQLASANAYINTASASGYNENIYTGSGSDPLVTVTNFAGAGGTPGTFQVHIPAGAQPAPGSDGTLSVDDTTNGTWYSFGGFHWTGSNSATVAQGSAESDSGSGIADDNSDWDEGVGTLRESDLQAGTIDHMLRVELPTSMLESVSNSAYQLASYAWPQTQEDGNGPSLYSGTVPFGVTIGIPAYVAEPANVAANPGANMLWQALQDHGAMVRDSGGGGNTVTFQADQNVSPDDPLIQGMEQYSSEIIGATQILTNQGPNSVNGGGTPIVPLDPPPSDASGGSASSSSVAASSQITLPATGASTTVSQSQISVVATTGDQMLFISGSGDQISLSGGSETITDTGGGNTYVLPAAGNGSDTFTSNILTAGDTLDLTAALAATDWDGSTGTLQNYLTVGSSGQNAVLTIAPTSGGAGTTIATIAGAGGAALSDILAHAIT
jgi:hypothetical protein